MLNVRPELLAVATRYRIIRVTNSMIQSPYRTKMWIQMLPKESAMLLSGDFAIIVSIWMN